MSAYYVLNIFSKSHNNSHKEGIIIPILGMVKLRCREVCNLYVITKLVNGTMVISKPKYIWIQMSMLLAAMLSCCTTQPAQVQAIRTQMNFRNNLRKLSRALGSGLKEKGNGSAALHYHSWLLSSPGQSLYPGCRSCWPCITHTPLVTGCSTWTITFPCNTLPSSRC